MELNEEEEEKEEAAAASIALFVNASKRFSFSPQLNILVILMEFKIVGNDIIIVFVLFDIIRRHRRYAINKLIISHSVFKV